MLSGSKLTTKIVKANSPTNSNVVNNSFRKLYFLINLLKYTTGIERIAPINTGNKGSKNE